MRNLPGPEAVILYEMPAREKLADPSSGQARDVDWEALVRLHRPRLLRVAYLMLGDPAEAEDAAQSALLKALDRRGEFRGEARATTWLHRILVNACLDRLRRRSRRRVAGPEAVEDLPARGTPEQDLLQSESTEAVRREILRLGPRHRAVVILRHEQELSYREMARILDCPVGTVRSRLAQAREILRERLEGWRR